MSNDDPYQIASLFSLPVDLSLMADGVDAFEPDFSLGDAFCPPLDMSDTGIT